MCAFCIIALLPWSIGIPMEEGLMSWYGEPFHGRLTACGEVYDMNEISVAHKTLPIGTEVVFCYNGHCETAIVNDRGPYYGNREWDASRRLAKRLFRDDLDQGVIKVHYYLTGNRIIRETMQYNL